MTWGDSDGLKRIALALGLGAAGGYLAELATVPLPWMLGPMIVCTLGAILGLPIKGPTPIRPPMVMILGVLLGSGFTPAMVDQAGQWALSLGLLALYVALGGALCYPYFRRVAGYDKPTAYFSAMPGGLNEMMLVGAEMGGDDRRIVLTHASRILITVLTIPILFRLTSDIDMTDRDQYGTGLFDVSLRDYLLLGGCIVVGYPLAKILRIPAPMLVGPMIASAVLHLTGASAAQPPLLIVNIAQWVMGTVIGCRFVGVARMEILRVIWMSIGSTLILLALTGVFAVALLSAETPFASAVLAYAPGGLAEMSLVALALGVDVAFVATHHVVRIVYVVIAAPLVYRKWLDDG
jgi:membrane AbrB-like protein